MGAHNFDDLRRHVGHKIFCVIYKNDDEKLEDDERLPENVAIECETCNEVLLDFDR